MYVNVLCAHILIGWWLSTHSFFPSLCVGAVVDLRCASHNFKVINEQTNAPMHQHNLCVTKTKIETKNIANVHNLRLARKKSAWHVHNNFCNIEMRTYCKPILLCAQIPSRNSEFRVIIFHEWADCHIGLSLFLHLSPISDTNMKTKTMTTTRVLCEGQQNDKRLHSYRMKNKIKEK